MHPNFLSPKAHVRADHDGWGSYALLPIAAGETVAAFGGRCITRSSLADLPVSEQIDSVQIDDDLFLVGDRTRQGVPGETINHSCAPNCGMSGGVLVVAMRDIAASETLSFDYAMCMGSDVNEFECECGAATCRHKVTGRDWMLPELQLAYRGSFSPYLAKRIAALISTGAARRAFAL
ncbi:MAG: SET domain-containing protein-lysine N-methyltransferase [Ilumatobacteraceae bacterium]